MDCCAILLPIHPVVECRKQKMKIFFTNRAVSVSNKKKETMGRGGQQSTSRRQGNGTFKREIHRTYMCETCAAGGRCIISSMGLFLCGPSKASTTQEVVDSAVSAWRLRYCHCQQKILPLAFEGQCFEKKQKSSVLSSLWGNGKRTVNEGWETQPTIVFSYTKLTRTYSLFMSLPPLPSCKLVFDNFCNMATIRKFWRPDWICKSPQRHSSTFTAIFTFAV